MTEELATAVTDERERIACLVEAAMKSLAKAIREGDAAPPRRKRKRTEAAPAAALPRRVDSASPVEMATVTTIWGLYPSRPEPQPYVVVRNVLLELLQSGVPAEALIRATSRYAQRCKREETEAKYITGMVRFFRDGLWKQYADSAPLVYGRTRDEWARSGQDVLEFDRLAGEITAKEVMAG